MFTGIVQSIGKIVSAASGGAGRRLVVAAPESFFSDVRPGDSISVGGICLTVETATASEARFSVLDETFHLTCLSSAAPGKTPVNLEKALTPSGRLGGHFVSGHVDETGAITDVFQKGSDRVVKIRYDGRIFRKNLIPKGSVAVDGVSLTVVDLSDDFFTVHVIEHTWLNTTFGSKSPGDPVNLEYDLIGKYVLRSLQSPGEGDQALYKLLESKGFTSK